MRQRLFDLFSHIALILIVFLVSVLVVFLFDPREVFTLEDKELLTNRTSYVPEDKILLKFKYCSAKDMNVQTELTLRDGIRVDGEVKVLPVYQGCGVIWLEVFDVPYMAYSEEYVIEGTLYYDLNPLRKVKVDIVSKPFQIEEQEGYLIKQFESGVDVF